VAAEMNCASTALGGIAPDMRAGDAEVIPQKVHEQLSGFDLGPPQFPVNDDSDVMARHGLSISSTGRHAGMRNDSSEASHTGGERTRQFYRQLKTPESAGIGDIGFGREASTVRVMHVDTRPTHTIAHTVNRLVIDTDAAFDDVLERYESLVPLVDFAKLTRLILSGDLSRVKQYTDELAPHSFVNFWTFDPTPMMKLVGHRTRVVTYMMGNNVIVERMFRHDPGVMVYAPLRTAIYEGADGRTHFSIDQPSTRFASFGDPRIAAVGLELDTKLAEILRLMSMPVPAELQRNGRPTPAS
jgi:Domain of unknown function DUF302